MAKPTYNAYSVRKYEKDGEKDSFWTKIGVAFAHKNGGGFDTRRVILCSRQEAMRARWEANVCAV
jgi:hypothetical protein